jgi:hypothetical protein
MSLGYHEASFTALAGRGAGRLWIVTVAAPCAALFAAVAPLAADPNLALLLCAPVTYFATVVVITIPPALQEIIPNRMRGITTAVALVTDYVIGDEQKLGYSLALVPPAAALFAALFAVSALKSYRVSRADPDR